MTPDAATPTECELSYVEAPWNVPATPCYCKACLKLPEIVDGSYAYENEQDKNPCPVFFASA